MTLAIGKHQFYSIDGAPIEINALAMPCIDLYRSDGGYVSIRYLLSLEGNALSSEGIWQMHLLFVSLRSVAHTCKHNSYGTKRECASWWEGHETKIPVLRIDEAVQSVSRVLTRYPLPSPYVLADSQGAFFGDLQGATSTRGTRIKQPADLAAEIDASWKKWAQDNQEDIPDATLGYTYYAAAFRWGFASSQEREIPDTDRK